jgi:hypothetical protein
MGYSRTKEEVTRYCDPVVTMGDLGLQVHINYTTNELASPCGLVARSVLNDTFTLYYPDDYEVATSTLTRSPGTQRSTSSSPIKTTRGRTSGSM